jgi:hypothetical protein
LVIGWSCLEPLESGQHHGSQWPTACRNRPTRLTLGAAAAPPRGFDARWQLLEFLLLFVERGNDRHETVAGATEDVLLEQASEGREHSLARRAPPPIARQVTGGVQVEIVEKSGLLSSKRKSSE